MPHISFGTFASPLLRSKGEENKMRTVSKRIKVKKKRREEGKLKRRKLAETLEENVRDRRERRGGEKGDDGDEHESETIVGYGKRKKEENNKSEIKPALAKVRPTRRDKGAMSGRIEEKQKVGRNSNKKAVENDGEQGTFGQD